MSLKVVKPWYEKGLKFKCTKCGKCCTGKNGYVWLREEDIENLRVHFKLSKKEFLKKYTRKAFGRDALKDLNEQGDCIFLKENQCSVHKSRPLQCRTFPWWPMVVDDESSWEEAKSYCEGINHPEGEIHSPDEIKKNVKKMLKADESN